VATVVEQDHDPTVKGVKDEDDSVGQSEQQSIEDKGSPDSKMERQPKLKFFLCLASPACSSRFEDGNSCARFHIF